MNLTKRPPYQKGMKRKSRGKARPPTAIERRHWARVRALGCIVGPIGCKGYISIHHCGTGAGGRKNHKKVIPLCLDMHHIGPEGIDGKRMSKRKWQEKYGTETILLTRVQRRLERAI